MLVANVAEQSGEAEAEQWRKLFVRSGCLAPTFRFFERCDVKAMRDQYVIRSCLDVTLTILLFMFGGGSDDDDDDDDDTGEVPPRLPPPAMEEGAEPFAPMRMKISGHIGGQSERVNGTYRRLE